MAASRAWCLPGIPRPHAQRRPEATGANATKKGAVRLFAAHRLTVSWVPLAAVLGVLLFISLFEKRARTGVVGVGAYSRKVTCSQMEHQHPHPRRALRLSAEPRSKYPGGPYVD